MLLRPQTLFIKTPVILIIHYVNMATWVSRIRPVLLIFLHFLNRLINCLSLIVAHLMLQKLLVARIWMQVRRRNVWLVLQHTSGSTYMLAWLDRLVNQWEVVQLVWAVLYWQSGISVSVNVKLRT